MLRRYRLLHGLKQATLAERLSVSQATISKWEKGDQLPNDERQSQLIALLAARPQGLDGTWLQRLVECSTQRVHVICDLTHRLLVASPGRYQEWGCSPGELFDVSLLSDAPGDIIEAENVLNMLEARRNYLRPMVLKTLGKTSGRYRVAAGYVLWERIQIPDGTWVRLVSSVDTHEIPADSLFLQSTFA